MLVFAILPYESDIDYNRCIMNTNVFKGERLDSKSALARNNLLEHLARYGLVQGKRRSSAVLDIGCGSGHGTYALSKRFSSVVGVDVSRDAIDYAKKNWNNANIRYLVGSGTRIPFARGTFDISVAFEVFEHISDWKGFLSELRRVTRRGGRVYISTPNKNLYSPGTLKPINPYHCFEMTPEQFSEALGDFFEIESLMGQRTPVYNDHWIWKVVDPVLFFLKRVMPYTINNSIKLRIINMIKPVLEPSDIVFLDRWEDVNRSRFMVAICKNTKK